MKTLVRIFIIFDMIALVFMAVQLSDIIQNHASIRLTSDKVQAILMFPMFALILVGIIGLIPYKKWGFALYYLQFPFRLYLLVFSIGFITFLPELFNVPNEKWINILFKLCFLAEFIRLYYTIQAQIYFSKRALA